MAFYRFGEGMTAGDPLSAWPWAGFHRVPSLVFAGATRSRLADGLCLRTGSETYRNEPELCDAGLCPDAPEEERPCCDHCPLDRKAGCQRAEKKGPIRRALDPMGALYELLCPHIKSIDLF